MSKKDDNCSHSNGYMKSGTTTFTVNYEKGVSVVKHVLTLGLCAMWRGMG